ncbi:MAG: two-component sensor histidine kinase, partial [Burkholderiaceae bacterium]
MRMQPRSMQARLLLLVLGTLVAVWFATAVLTWLDVRHELDEMLDAHLAQAAALLVAQQVPEIEGEAEEHHEREPGLDAPSLHRYARRVAFQVFHEGRLAWRIRRAHRQAMV